MKFRATALMLTLGLAFATGANAVTIGFNPRTGDIWVDTQLRAVNQYGYDNRDYFIDDLVTNYGAPRYLVNDLLFNRRWAPGDVYYACVLAYRMHRPCGDVVHMYEEDNGDHGHGWGVIAQRMGIKPGSAAFHALKGDVDRSNGRFKTHGHGHGNGDEDGDRDNGGRDNGGRDNGSAGMRAESSGGHQDKHGNSGEHGQGNSGEHGNGGGEGKGKSKKGGGGHG